MAEQPSNTVGISNTLLLEGLTLTITTPADLAFREFADGVRRQLSRTAERLGIRVHAIGAETTAQNTPKDLCIVLAGNDWQAESRIPLLDESGCYLSELTLQAMSGIMAVHSRKQDGFHPLGVDYVTSMVAIFAFDGLLAQASEQLRHGSQTPAPVSVCSPVAVALLTISQYLADATAEEPFPLPDDFDDPACQPPFVSADGVAFELESLAAEPWRLFWHELGASDREAAIGWRNFQLRYAKAVSPISKSMVAALSERSYDAIAALCQATGMQITPVNSLSHAAASEGFKTLWHNGPWFYRTVASSPVPCADEDTHSDSAVSTDAVPLNHVPLHRIRVIESCRRIQGPMATHILSLLGADVVRLEPPGGDPLRGMPPVGNGCSVRFDALNRMKTVAEVNIKTAEGRQQIADLTVTADVFIHNWAPGKAQQLQLSDAELCAQNPKLIYSYAGGWAESLSTAEDVNGLPGTDFVVQARAGIAQTISLKSASNVQSTLFTVLDTLGGALASQAVLIGLLCRSLTGKTHYVETSLLGAATLLVDRLLQDIYTDQSATTRHSTFAGVFETATEPVAVDLPPLDQASELAQFLELDTSSDFAPRDNSERDTAIKQAFKRFSAQQLLEALPGFNIPVTPVCQNLCQLSEQSLTQPWLKQQHYTGVMSPWSYL